MKEAIKKFNVKKFLNILSYVGVAVFFLFALVCAIAKFNGAKFVLFGRRYDVVLTNSMSEKNEKYKDFLKGHNDQFDAFDLAVSKKIESPEDLHVYDVVIYKDRTVGTNMHRIVDIVEDGHDEIRYEKAVKASVDSVNGICLPVLSSKVEFSDIAFKDAELKVYTKLTEKVQHYNFSIINETIKPKISYTKSGSGMIVTYKIHKDDLGKGLLTISHSKTFDYSKEVILSLTVDATGGQISSTAKNVSAKGDDLLGIYNRDYWFEIRGDKSSTSDGVYKFTEIEAKVVKNIRNGGYFVRFLNSIWGGIMFILLGFLIITMQLITNRSEKKAKAANNAPVSEVKTEEVSEVKKEDISTEKVAPLKDEKGRFISRKKVDQNMKQIDKKPKEEEK